MFWGSVSGSVCIVETIAIKISSKTQKKFAILTISDGLERFELPVWPDLFEQKGALLQENQLLYVILQVERKTDALHLQCRYIDDLTLIDEERLQECQAQYDRLKAQTKVNDLRQKAAKKPKDKPAEKEEEAKLVRLKLNADQIRFSGILALKNLFRQHPGKSPLEIHFVGAKKHWGTIQIDGAWGVKADLVFREKIEMLSQQLGTQIECLSESK